MPTPSPISYFNRHTGQIETEAVYGEGFLRWVYEHPLGESALHALVKRQAFSRWYGWKMDQPASKTKILPFIQAYGLNPAEFDLPVQDFSSFNDFFCRRLKPDARPVNLDPRTVVFPADGRHLLLRDIAASSDFFVKGVQFNLSALLKDEPLAENYANGDMLISRLCPVDYHRFHYPWGGTSGQPIWINGPLYSVSPIALRRRPSILWENKRCRTALRTETLGVIIYIEVGATCVGTIVHTVRPKERVEKGEEKGYFRFGGSCVITLYEAGRVAWDQDLVQHGAEGREVYGWMGERCGSALDSLRQST